MLTPDNIWIVGIAQEPSTCDYYLVFYHDMREVLNRVMQTNTEMRVFQYSDFEAIEEIGAGGYGTVYKAKCKSLDERIVVLKCFKNFDWMPELFVAEVSIVRLTVMYGCKFR
jgi:hypothetical protein